MTKRAVLYARVSYDDRKNEARNLEGQIADGRAYCQEKGYRIVAELAEDDRGASGASWDLPKLNQALDMARENAFDVLVTRELDRLARGLAKQLVIEGEFKRHGIKIEYVLAEYPDTPEGNLNKNIKAVIAEYERFKIEERMTRGRRNIVKGGKVMLHGQGPPFGYRRNEQGLLTIYEPEAKIIKMIYHWYASGERFSIKAITKRLTEMAIPTHADIHDGEYKKASYGEWSEGTVSDILANETYAGLWHYGKRDRESKWNPRDNWLSVEVPAIVSRETWDLAQRRKTRNRQLASRNSKYEYLLGRRVRCGVCNKFAMFGKAIQSGRYKYYMCPGTRQGICDQGYFPVALVDGQVWGWVKSLLQSPDNLVKELQEHKAKMREQMQPLWERVQVIDGLLADKRGQLEKLLDLYLQGDFAKEILAEKRAQLENLIHNLEMERTCLTYEGHEVTLDARQIKSIEDVARRLGWDLAQADVDFATRRRMIEALDVTAVLAVEDGQKVAYVRCIIRPEETLAIEDATTNTGSYNDQQDRALVMLTWRIILNSHQERKPPTIAVHRMLAHSEQIAMNDRSMF